MKKKFLAGLLSLCMIFSLMPMSVFASPAVPTVDTVDELIQAINSGETEIIINSPIVIPSGTEVTIEANSPVILKSDQLDVLEVAGTLNLGENITIESTSSILYVNGGRVNVDGANLVSSSSANTLAFVENGILNIYSGSVTGTKSQTTISLGANASCNIYGGTVEAKECSAIKVKDGATVTVDGGTVKCAGSNSEGGFAAIFTTGNGIINVNSGTVTSAAGSALDANAGTVNVTGGTITGAEGIAAVKKEDAGIINIVGGTFSSDVKGYLAPGFTQNNDTVVPCDHAGDHTWTVTAPATCTAAGTETATCTCGTIVTRATALAAHSFGGWYTTKEPNCYNAGVEVHVCTACGLDEGRPLPATTHNFDVNGICAICGLTKDTVVAATPAVSAPSRANPNTGVHF